MCVKLKGGVPTLLIGCHVLVTLIMRYFSTLLFFGVEKVCSSARRREHDDIERFRLCIDDVGFGIIGCVQK